MLTQQLVDYPIFSLALNNDFIIISGGGGGEGYGIKDTLDVYRKNTDNTISILYSWDKTPGILESLQYSPLQKLWIGYLDAKCYTFSVSNDKVTQKCTIEDKNNITCCKFGDEAVLALGFEDGSVSLYKLTESGKESSKLIDLNEHKKPVKDVVLHSDKCLSACEGKILCLWNASNGDLLHKKTVFYEEEETACRFIKYFDAGKFGDLFITLNHCKKGNAILFLLRIDKIGEQHLITTLRSILINSSPGSSLALNEKKELAVGFGSGDIALVCTKKWKVKKKLKVHQLPVTGLDFMDENVIISGGIDFLLKVTSVKSKFSTSFTLILLSILLSYVFLLFTNYNR